MDLNWECQAKRQPSIHELSTRKKNDLGGYSCRLKFLAQCLAVEDINMNLRMGLLRGQWYVSLVDNLKILGVVAVLPIIARSLWSEIQLKRNWKDFFY